MSVISFERERDPRRRDADMFEFPLPTDVQAERAFLGSCLMDREAAHAVRDLLPDGAAFFIQRHADIYEKGVLACLARQTPPDLSTVASALKNAGVFEEIGGLEYLLDLSNEVPTAVHVEYYAQTVRDAWVRRRLIEMAGQIKAHIYNTLDEPLDSVVTGCERLLRDTTTLAVTKKSFISYAEVLRNEYAEQARLNSGAPADLISTGIRDLDRLLDGGMERQNLALIAARPGVGKTDLALHILDHAITQQMRAGFLSLEMSNRELGRRNLSKRLKIRHRFLREGLSGDALERFVNLVAHTEEADPTVYFDALDDGSAATFARIRRSIRQMHQAAGSLDVVIIDYLQLIQGDDTSRRTENRNLEVGAISRGLKLLSKELNCAVIALSQLSRAVESRPDKRPVLSDLRDSGSLEQDADIVMFLYRDELYNTQTDKPGVTEVIVSKNRHNALGVVSLQFDGAFHTFTDIQAYHGVPGFES